jgi:hypothetical protein
MHAMSPSAELVNYYARCHCGALSASYRTTIATSSWPMRLCQCAFCRAHGATSTSDPAGELTFAAAESALLQRYQFGTRSADFLICRACGVFMGAVMTIDSRRWGVLNVRTVQPIPLDLPPAQAMSYDGEASSSRAERRTQRWTPLTAESL